MDSAMFERATPLERARDTLAEAISDSIAAPTRDGGAQYARAAQMAVVAQAEAAHRQAAALERIAELLADLRRDLSDVTYQQGIGVVIRP